MAHVSGRVPDVVHVVFSRHEPLTTTSASIVTTASRKFTGKERDAESGLDNSQGGWQRDQ
jgi:hypothetical protein